MMKPVALLTLLSVTLLSPAILADELTSAENDPLTYCEELATQAGIEDASEKAEYIRDCAQSYGVEVGEASSAD